MKLPYLTPPDRSIATVSTFGGLNRGARVGTGELSDMKNLTSDAYPILSTRERRGILPGIGESVPIRSTLLAGDNLSYTHDRFFVVDSLPTGGDPESTKLTDIGLSDSENTYLVSMGSYVLIFPEKKYINLSDTSEYGDIEFDITAEGAVLEPCDSAGAAYEKITVSATAPESPESGDLWLDTSVSPAAERVWSEADGEWSSLPAIYVRMTVGVQNAEGLSAGDGVTIKFPNAEDDERLSSVPRSAVISSVADGKIVFPGHVLGRISGMTVRISRTMPEMDIVFECGNRLWGCRYGENASGAPVNEIYASKLGDFKNWNCFENLSTDSFVASLGSEGAFTGGTAYLGMPIFFREGYIHKIYGDRPSQFSVQTNACSGVAPGCGASIAEVDGILYYRSRCAVCAYDGSLPVPVSAKLLPDGGCTSAVAGALGSKYYISMKDKSGKSTLCVYDTSRSLWHVEDDTDVVSFASVQGELFYIDAADRSVIRTVRGSGTEDGTPIPWYAVTGIIGEETPEKKYISELMIRLRLQEGGRVSVYAEYDSGGTWEHLSSIAAGSLRSFVLPVRPRRCDHMRLRIEGEGDAQIFSISRVYETGSEF